MPAIPSFGGSVGRPGTASFTTVKPGAAPKGPAIPKGRAGITFTSPGPTLHTSVPTRGNAPFPTTPGGAPPQAAPQATTTPPPAPAAADQTSPLDSTYFGNLAANNFRVGNQINSLTRQGQDLTTNLQAALAQLAYQQPRDSLKLEQGANRRGALYSSVYNQDLGNLNNTYQTKQSGLVRTNAQRQAGIAGQIGALQGGIPIYEGQQYDAAVGRATKAAAANPATGQAPAVPPPGPPAPGLPTPALPGAPATSTGMNPGTVLAGRPTAQPRSSRQQLAQKIATMSFSGLGKGRR